MNAILLQNQTMRLEFSPQTGALTGFTALRTAWNLLDRPQLGLSFRLLMPLGEERRDNSVLGEKQRLTSFEAAPDGRSVTFVWNGVESEYGGWQDVRLTLRVVLGDLQAEYQLTVDNRSSLVVENVYCPYLGDVTPPPGAEWFKTFIYSYGSAAEWNLWPHYDNLRGYFGVDYPTQFAPWSPAVGAPMSPFFLLRSQDQGLYAAVSRPSPELVAWHTELRPGYGSSIDFRVPETRTLSTRAGEEMAVATRFAAVHVPFIQPGETRELTPIVLQPFEGDWQNGVELYKRWRKEWIHNAPVPGWAREPHAWQQIHINSPEDELRVRFTDLPRVGEECARHGVKAIQLVGWNDGGQDQGNPSHDPDPRLGTFAELKEAIAKIQAMGVKIILFAKFTWADRATAWFRQDLHRLAVKDPYGDTYMHPGYQYQTATQLLDINTKRLIPMCFSSEEYLRVCDREFAKTLELGADGILFDECLHHGPALLCFDESHGHRSGAPVYENDRRLIQNFHHLSDPVRPDFLFAGEATYDWEFDAYALSYHRSENKKHIPLSRFMSPSAQIMTAVTGFNDRSMINQCLMYRYIISYEPYNFKGHLDDYPLTMAYGKQMDALRAEFRDYFWDGEYRGTLGAQVKNGAALHHPYAVFLNAKTARPGLVICNYSEKETLTLSAESPEAIFTRYRLVDEPTWKQVSDGIRIPPLSAAIVLGD